MGIEQESMETRIVETESIIQECRQRIKQAIEDESDQLKEEAKLESSRIIAMAEEQADKTISQARQEAGAESERIIAGAKQEARQITRASREQSARVINEAKNKAAQIIKEAMECNTAQAQKEIARAAYEARTRTSELMAQVNQSIEQIIGDTETRIKVEFERLTTVITEVETELPPPEEVQDEDVDTKPQAVTDEVVKPITPVIGKSEPVIPAAENAPSSPKKETEDTRLFEGYLTLEIVSPFGEEHQGGLPERLRRIRSLTVEPTGSYSRANRRITKYTVDLGQPTPLLKILKALPQVKEISEHKEKIEVTLR